MGINRLYLIFLLDIARLFATFSIGDRVKLTFARSYQLPFDLNEDVDYISVTLTKGQQGFGFTISDALVGQRVKKILDVDRCGSLKQGDILMSLNGQDLSSLSHTEVVEVLKQCPIDSTAVLMVKRKKRFRSKTPVALHSSSGEIESVPVRNCKTPNAEMMMRRDLDWFLDDNSNYQQQQQRQNTAPGSDTQQRFDENSNSFPQNNLKVNVMTLFDNFYSPFICRKYNKTTYILKDQCLTLVSKTLLMNMSIIDLPFNGPNQVLDLELLVVRRKEEMWP